MQIGENVRMAFSSLRMNKLRSILTMIGIVVGVFSIIGVMTALGVLQQSINSSLSQLGAETFTVHKFPTIQTENMAWMKYMHRKSITYEQIKYVREFAHSPLAVSAEHMIAPLTVAYGNEKSDPQFQLQGSDDFFTANHNFILKDGRMLSREDIEFARDVVVLGEDVINRVFKTDKNNIVGKTVRLNSRPYTVIGTFEPKGGGAGQSQDNFALIPITNLVKYHSDRDLVSLTLTVRAKSQQALEATQDEIIGLLRAARGVKPGAENDFEVETNSSLTQQFDDLSKYVYFAGFGISAIALIAASIGIMNIMLVSVTERTKEIGIRKALGARRADITGQFLMEAVVLCEIGGIVGIGIGIAFGNIVAIFMKAPVYIPYAWIGIGLLVCSAVGIIFGMYPAMKAARMHPIDALRFE
jgi:putative ABC transport system permease protein